MDQPDIHHRVKLYVNYHQAKLRDQTHEKYGSGKPQQVWPADLRIAIELVDGSTPEGMMSEVMQTMYLDIAAEDKKTVIRRLDRYDASRHLTKPDDRENLSEVAKLQEAKENGRVYILEIEVMPESLRTANSFRESCGIPYFQEIMNNVESLHQPLYQVGSVEIRLIFDITSDKSRNALQWSVDHFRKAQELEQKDGKWMEKIFTDQPGKLWLTERKSQRSRGFCHYFTHTAH